ncbi:adenosylcobinamide amidohydrolase [Williamsia sp. CHRR-6]|nr:adenosylcobinamide amidohydrolase [Williamsia sp. CHRR-6]
MRADGDASWPILRWRPPIAYRMVSSAPVGGGAGDRRWWLNAMVSAQYFHPDPQAHLAEMAAHARLFGLGVGMLTAADVRRRMWAADETACAVATVGLGVPIWAAASDRQIAAETHGRVGTINILVVVNRPVSDAALVNLVVTATEAKTQALLHNGCAATGTSSDAIAVAAPIGAVDDEGRYGGPRSTVGISAARCVAAAVGAGTRDWLRWAQSRRM